MLESIWQVCKLSFQSVTIFLSSKTIFSWNALLDAQWKSEEVAVFMTTSLTVENHKRLFMNTPGHTQHPPVTPKLLILILNLGICAFLIQWTNCNTRFYISTWFDTAVSYPVDQDMKQLILSKAERSADQTVLSTVTPSCFLFRTANFNSSNQQTSNNLTSSFKQQKARQKRTCIYSPFFTEKLSNHIYKCNIF